MWRPGPEDVRHYEEHGWLTTPKLFGPSELAAARAAVADHHHGHRDRELPIGLHPCDDWRPGDPSPLRRNEYVALTSDALAEFLLRPQLAAIASELVGGAGIRLWSSGIIYKPPGTDGPEVTICWHTDKTYWRSCSSRQMLTAWVPLDGCDESSGTLIVLDGSHLWRGPKIDDARLAHSFMGTRPEVVEKYLASSGVEMKKIPMNLEAGQVSFHHCMLFHGSGANLSPRPRIALTLHLQDAPNTYLASGDIGTHNNNRLCRSTAAGEPDYTDPRWFPLLWGESIDPRRGPGPV